MTAKRHGWAAVLLSLLTPGLGHLYAGRVRAALVLGILVTPFAAFLFLLDVLAAPPPALFFLFGVAILLTVVVGIPIHAALLARRTGSAYQLRTFNRSYVYIAFFVLVGLVWQRGRRTQCTRKNDRSEEHTSELQSHSDLVCRLMLETNK